MRYTEALEYIQGTQKLGSKLGLESITELAARLGNPQNMLKTIHVAGTNGKGSVTAMTASILHKAGYRVGMYTSPSLENIREVIQVDFEMIPETEFALLTGQIKAACDSMVSDGLSQPTEFELLTVMAFLYFVRRNVDYAVIEVGLGGRLDATNIINPLVSVITSISLEHTAVLGDTLGKIASEKGGIIKKDTPVITYPQEEEADKVLAGIARDNNAPYIRVTEDSIIPGYMSFYEQHFDFDPQGIQVVNRPFRTNLYGDNPCQTDLFIAKPYKDIKIHLPGKHQLLNAACALTCISELIKLGVEIEDTAVYEGMDSVKWPCRLEKLQDPPTVILDGAHNPSGARILADALNTYFSGRKVHLIIGIFKDKDVESVVKILVPAACSVTVTMSYSNPRAMPANELAAVVRQYHDAIEVRPDLRDAIESTLARVSEDDIVVISGSLNLAGQARSILLNS